jgi:hypothetical protein
MNRANRAIPMEITAEAFAVPQRSRQAHFAGKKEIA